MVPLGLVQFYLNESSFTEPFKGTQDTIEEDDGGIYVGNPEPKRLANHSSEGQPSSKQ